MRQKRLALLAGSRLTGLAFVVFGSAAMAVEEAPYTVEHTDGDFQVRRYAPQIVAETLVEGSMEEAGNKAFRRLFNYISGANRSKGRIAMTTPVAQQPAGEKLPMTAPVAQQLDSNFWAVAFVMPTGYTLATLPEPMDAQVHLRAIPARRVRAIGRRSLTREMGSKRWSM